MLILGIVMFMGLGVYLPYAFDSNKNWIMKLVLILGLLASLSVIIIYTRNI